MLKSIKMKKVNLPFFTRLFIIQQEKINYENIQLYNSVVLKVIQRDLMLL